MSTCVKGRTGEAAADRYLTAAGCTVLCRNFRRPGGEIDIVALDGGDIVFVEVKAWDAYGVEDVARSISRAKRRKIISTARRFLAEHPRYDSCPVRFDVVLVRGGREVDHHWKGAFADL